jgi:uncharacterized membrane protein YhaH (DUF805 family)
MVWYLFKFEGRINRAKCWLAGLIILCWMIVPSLLLYAPIKSLFGLPAEVHFDVDNVFALLDPQFYRALSRADFGAILLNAIIMPPCLWVFAATSVKRLHDRDKSGWWMVPFFVVPGLIGHFSSRLGGSPVVMALGLVAGALLLWGNAEMYFLRGSSRTNLYGPNPLPKTQSRPRSKHAGATTGWDQHGELQFAPHRAGLSAGARVNPRA